jgi:hypothetical protein
MVPDPSLRSVTIPQVLKKLGLEPKTTIRTLLSSASEFRYFRPHCYLSTHKDEVSNIRGLLLADVPTTSEGNTERGQFGENQNGEKKMCFAILTFEQ